MKGAVEDRAQWATDPKLTDSDRMTLAIQSVVQRERIAAVDEYRREILLIRSLDRFKASRKRLSVNDHIAEIMREDEEERMKRDFECRLSDE